MAYEKKELTGMSYADVKAAAQALNIPISREGGGGRKSKVELVDGILEAQEEGDEEEVYDDEDEELELDDMTRKELKVLAKELGLKIGGSKAELVDRISDYYDEDEDADEEEDDEDEEEDEDWDDEDTIELTLDDLDDMTVKELKALAAELGVEKPERRKAQIIDQIVDAAGEDDEEDEEEWEDEEEDDDTVDYDSLTRKELKALCAARKLPKGGSKTILVSRLEEADSDVEEADEDEPEEVDEEATSVAAVTGPTGPLETAAADMVVGSSFILMRQSADKWTLTPTAGAFVPAGGIVSTAPVHDEFSSMSRTELKDELRQRGLTVGGRKAEQLDRLRNFATETAGTTVTRKYKGRAWKAEVYSDQYKKYIEKSRAKSYTQFVKFAKKKGAKWEKHADERIDRIRASMALQDVLGIEKYKPEYQDQAARQAIKG